MLRVDRESLLSKQEVTNRRSSRSDSEVSPFHFYYSPTWDLLIGTHYY